MSICACSAHERARVLVVEDDRDVSALLRRHLESLGHRVTPALSGEDGLRSAAGDPPDVAVVDIGLPGVCGRSVIDFLQASDGTGGCKVVLASAIDSEDLDLDVDAVLSKPFRRADVAHAMTAVGFPEVPR